MKVLVINGSPHLSGCTDRALREVEKTLAECGIETERVNIGNKRCTRLYRLQLLPPTRPLRFQRHCQRDCAIV